MTTAQVDLYEVYKLTADKGMNAKKRFDGLVPTKNENNTLSAVPINPADVDCAPAFAVMSPRLSSLLIPP